MYLTNNQKRRDSTNNWSDYIEKTKNIIKRQIYSVKELPKDKTICIYGTGSAGLYLLERIRKNRKDLVVKCLIDSFKKCDHSSGLPQICISDFQKQHSKNDLVVIASIFAMEIESTLLSLGIQQYNIYTPNYYDVNREHHHNRIKTWHYATYRSLHIIDSPQKCFTGKTIFSIFMKPLGSYIAHKRHHPIENHLFKKNKMVGSADLSAYSKNIFQKISKQIEMLRPEAVVLSAIQGDFSQAVMLIDSYFKSHSAPLFLVPSLSKLSWRGIYIPNSKWSFIYMPKCGSSSFLYTFRETYEPDFTDLLSNVDPHTTPSHQSILRDHPYPETGKSDRLFFSIVRNPYHRLASLYHRCQKGPFFFYDALKKIQQKNFFTFEEFCNFVCTCPDSISDDHFRSQYSYLTTPEGEFFMNKIFKLEDLIQDKSPIEDLLGKRLNIHHLGKSNTEKINYMTSYYHSPSIKKLVFKRYQEDFNFLGYDPDI